MDEVAIIFQDSCLQSTHLYHLSFLSSRHCDNEFSCILVVWIAVSSCNRRSFFNINAALCKFLGLSESEPSSSFPCKNLLRESRTIHGYHSIKLKPSCKMKTWPFNKKFSRGNWGVLEVRWSAFDLASAGGDRSLSELRTPPATRRPETGISSPGSCQLPWRPLSVSDRQYNCHGSQRAESLSDDSVLKPP